MIYGRFGNAVTIERRATLADVEAFDNRPADKDDRQAVKAGSRIDRNHGGFAPFADRPASPKRDKQLDAWRRGQ